MSARDLAPVADALERIVRGMEALTERIERLEQIADQPLRYMGTGYERCEACKGRGTVDGQTRCEFCNGFGLRVAEHSVKA